MHRWMILLTAAIALPALAGGASHWTHTSETDFSQGTMHNTVSTNLGDVKLSRAVKTLLEQDADIDAVYALAEGSDKTLYAATGPKGIVLQIKNDKVTRLATLEDGGSIFSLTIDAKGNVLVGSGGESGKVYRIEKGSNKPTVIFEQEGVQYIWSIRQTADGLIYAATGPEGQLFEISPDGTHRAVFDCDENNLLSMTSDGKDMLYVGTDPDGLVYRINRKTGESFVLYDAAESEVTALALDAHGNLYAATGQSAGELQPPAEKPNAGEPNGRPEAPMEPKQLMDAPGDIPPGDKPEPPPHATTTETIHPPGNVTPPINGPTGAPPENGNAVYRIDKSGTVTEIFRQHLAVISMIESNGQLLIGTGSGGLIYQINPAADETIVLAKVDSKEVMAMLPASDGRVILGLANAGAIATMSSGFAAEGTFLSPVLDATQISQFGKIQMHSTTPQGTSIKVATRSGNLQDPNEKTWSKWSDDVPAGEFLSIKTPAARFFQYRITLTSNGGKDTPVLEDMDVAYLQPNLAPQIKSIKITASTKNDNPSTDTDHDAAQPKSQRHQTITWECTDPNSDVLEYSLFLRTAPKGQWILLKDKLKDLTWEWDTRSTADGRYEIKLVASDMKSNATGAGKTASRLSDPVLVDNTAPVISDLKAEPKGNEVSIDAKISDRAGTVASLDYAVDSSADWQAVTALDNIFDQPEESASFKVSGLSAGAHQITLRATDARGNQAFESVTVRIESPTASK